MKKRDIIEILVENHGQDEKELETMKKDDLVEMLDNYENTSLRHPNESYDEFMDHEDFD